MRILGYTIKKTSEIESDKRRLNFYRQTTLNLIIKLMSNDSKKVFRVSYQTLTEPKQINIRALTFAGAENYFYSMYPAKDNTITNIEKL